MAEDKDQLQDGELTQGEGLYAFLKTEIAIATDWQSGCQEKVSEVYKIYKDDRKHGSANSNKKVNLFWSSLQTMKPSVFASVPKVDVRRRNADRDRIKRMSAEILERATEYSLDCHQDFEVVATSALDDFLVAGRAVFWERYKFKKEKTEERIPILPEELQSGMSQALNRQIQPQEVQQDEQGYFVWEPVEKITSQESITDYVSFEDFLHNPARTKDEIRWQARRHYFTKAELNTLWPKLADSIELTKEPEGLNGLKINKEEQKRYKKAEVFEIWNLEDRKVYYFSPGYDQGAIEIKDDPLGLKNFFPSTTIYDFVTPQELLPTPEYCMAQDQLEEINSLTDRIDAIVKIIRANAACPAELKDKLDQLLGGDNIIVGIPNWMAFQQNGGLELMRFLPIEQHITVLQQLLGARETAKQLYYEVTRQSDLMRGVSDPTETASAQDIKSGYADVTLKSKQRKFQKFLRDAIRIKAEIVAEQFEPEILYAMTGAGGFSEQMTQEEYFACIDLLKNDTMRDYAINIETDSTIIADERRDKQNVSEFINSITPYLQQTMQSLKEAPELAPSFLEMLLMFMRSFNISSGVEDSVEIGLRDILEKQKLAAQQPPPPPPVDPVVVQLQNETAIQHEKNEYQLQIKQMELQQHERDLTREEAQIISDAQIEQQKLQIQKEELMLQAEKQRNDFWLQLEELKIKAGEADKALIESQLTETPASAAEANLPPIQIAVQMPEAKPKVARFETLPDGTRQAVITDMVIS